MKRRLILENGTCFTGKSFGSETEQLGELNFYTGMTGYQEMITDPSNAGQMMMMTYPLIGNYGINRDDFETVTPSIRGLIVKEVAQNPSNFRSDETLDQYLKANDIPAIAGVDTRKIMRMIREEGTMKAMMTSADQPVEEVIQLLKNTKLDDNLVKETSTANPYVVPGRGMRIVMVDYGAKHGILRELTKRDCHITVVPYDYGAENIFRLKPDGLLLPNGPGNPKNLPDAVKMIEEILGKLPLFGIGLGHQLLALAGGANTEKMKFGHHGTNYAVKQLHQQKSFLTSQNHNYTVNEESLTGTGLEITEIGLNDGTVEGIKHKKYPAFSVQYNPEGSPGSEESARLFDQFIEMIETKQREAGRHA